MRQQRQQRSRGPGWRGYGPPTATRWAGVSAWRRSRGGWTSRSLYGRVPGGPRDSGTPTALRHNGAMNRASLDKDPSDVGADVRRRRRALRPHQRRALARPGPALAPGDDQRPRLRARGPRPRHRRRHGDQLGAAGRRRRGRRAGRLLARHAAGRPPPSPRHAVHGGRRDAPAVRRRLLRRRHDVVRAAQRRRPRRRPRRVPAGHQARRPAGRLRVQPPGERRVPRGLPPLPHARAAPGRPPRSRRTPTPTSTSPSRSRRGPRSATWP